MARTRTILLLACVLPLLASCGGGSPSPGPAGVNFAILEGTWFGVRVPGGTLGGQLSLTMTLSVGPMGMIQGVAYNGEPQPVTGQLAFAQETPNGFRLWSFLLSDGTKGGLLTDAPSLHASYIDDAPALGVLQKGAASFPPYMTDQVVGSWSGIGVQLDGELNLTQVLLPSQTQITGVGSFTSQQAMAFNFTNDVGSTVNLLNPPIGVYGARFADSLMQVGQFMLALSPDLSFVGAFTTPDGADPLTGSTFYAWTR